MNKLGIDGQLLYDALGASNDTFVEISNVRDLTLSLESGDVDNTTRAGGGWKSALAGTRDASIEFDMNYDLADAVITALRTAWLAGTKVGFYIKDQSAGAGLKADFILTSFNVGQPRDGDQTLSISCKLHYDDIAPAWA